MDLVGLFEPPKKGFFNKKKTKLKKNAHTSLVDDYLKAPERIKFMLEINYSWFSKCSLVIADKQIK